MRCHMKDYFKVIINVQNSWESLQTTRERPRIMERSFMFCLCFCFPVPI